MLSSLIIRNSPQHTCKMGRSLQRNEQTRDKGRCYGLLSLLAKNLRLVFGSIVFCQCLLAWYIIWMKKGVGDIKYDEIKRHGISQLKKPIATAPKTSFTASTSSGSGAQATLSNHALTSDHQFIKDKTYFPWDRTSSYLRAKEKGQYTGPFDLVYLWANNTQEWSDQRNLVKK